MRPIINRVKNTLTDARVIIVADRGLNTSDNIYYLNGDNKGDNNQRDGYVYGQSIRGADAEFKEWILSEDYKTDCVIDDDGNEISFVHKSRIHPKELHVNVTKPGRKKPVKKKVVVDQKQMVYFSEKYKKKQRADREVMITRAKDLIAHPKKYDKITSAGSASYVKNISFSKTTGEIIEGKELLLDEDKIKEEEKYDGHFITCFTSLVFIRLIQGILEHRYPSGAIKNSLKKYCCIPINTSLYQFIYNDKILDDCSKTFKLNLNNKYRSRQEIQRLLKY